MFIHRPEEGNGRLVVAHWFLLSFSGGAINAGGFLATGRFVSHVTGFATLFGVDLAKWQLDAAVGILSVPIFFLAGSVIAGLLIDRPIYRNRAPRFDLVMGLATACLVTAACYGHFQIGGFGEVVKLKQVYLLLALLCLASGLQNAAIASSSGGAIRTTHITGLTTDLGLGFARLITLKHRDEKFLKERRANTFRAGSILCFALGSAAGAWIFLNVGFAGFLLPASIALYAAYQGTKLKIYSHGK